jgi:hypothetical protein
MLVGAALVILVGAGVYLRPRSAAPEHTTVDDIAPLHLAASTAPELQSTRAQRPATTTFADDFSATYTLNEADNASDSASANWWLSAGGYFYSAGGVGRTVSGSLPAGDQWRVAYAASNPKDTDGGYHPQNIFRLVQTAGRWRDYTQEAYFNISQDELSASPNRNASNGLFFFNRYQNEDTLYYTGIRVDGTAVIKKKYHGTYYTMTDVPLFITTGGRYDAANNPDLLPKHVWIGLRSVVRTNADGTVGISLYVAYGKTGHWVLAAQATDDGTRYGGAVIADAGYAGIRTDFMDVRFSGYRITEDRP